LFALFSWRRVRVEVIERFFGWWNGATPGALFDIKRRASLIGQDEQGNRFFEERKPSLEGRKRRYVIYKGLADPSRITADWHGWMHHTFDDPPTVAPLPRKAFERDHQANMTGTLFAYRPKGAEGAGDQRASSSGDYEAWKPGSE
jgi:NADH:ubiquinone oxidoreductase subunit